MASQLEKGHDLLGKWVDLLQAGLDTAVARLSQTASAGAEPEAPPGLFNEQIAYLQTAVESLVGRLQIAEPQAESFDAAIVNAQAKIDVLKVASASSGRTVGANSPMAARTATRSMRC